MNKSPLLISIMFVMFLLALLLTGCENPPWESGRLLVLDIDTPKDGTTVNTSTIPVSGHLVGTESKGAKVSVNGADVPVKDLHFSTDVTLTDGSNVINIGATTGQVDLKQLVNVTYVQTKK